MTAAKPKWVKKALRDIDQFTHTIEHKFSNEVAISPKYIAGKKCTLHAIARMMARRICSDYVVGALDAPYREVPDQKRPERKLHRHVSMLASVTVDPASEEIITVGYGTANDPFWDHDNRWWRETPVELTFPTIDDWRASARTDKKRREYERLMMPGKY